MIPKVRRAAALALYYGLLTHLPTKPFPLGELSRKLRARCCKRFLISAGDWINVETGVFLGDGRHVSLGNGSGFGRGCQVFGARVGEGVMVAPEAVLLSRNHRFEDLERPIGAQGDGPVEVPVIEDWAWIGYRAIVLPGRTIGRGAIVGAGSVVTKDVAPFDIVAGNPARVVGSRRDEAVGNG